MKARCDPEPRSRQQDFGGLSVVEDLSFTVRCGSRTALIGPNGAGKTTVFNLISGVFPLDTGAFTCRAYDIYRVPSRLRIRHGIARTFQNVRLMPHLSTLENVIVGQHWRHSGLAWHFPSRQPDSPATAGAKRRARRSPMPDLPIMRAPRCASLPYGVQKRIEVVRALMAKPALLLLDEPAAGLNPAETEALQIYLDQLCVRGGNSRCWLSSTTCILSARCAGTWSCSASAARSRKARRKPFGRIRRSRKSIWADGRRFSVAPETLEYEPCFLQCMISTCATAAMRAVRERLARPRERRDRCRRRRQRCRANRRCCARNAWHRAAGGRPHRIRRQGYRRLAARAAVSRPDWRWCPKGAGSSLR